MSSFLAFLGVSLVVIVMLITTGGQIKNLFSDITYTLNNQAGL